MKILLFAFCTIFSLSGNAQTWSIYNAIPNSAHPIPHGSVHSIAEDLDSTLWLSNSEGVSHFDGKTWQNYSVKDGLPSKNISFVFIDKKGIKWFGTSDAGVCKFDGSQWIVYNTNNGITSNNVTSIVEDKEGKIWLGHNTFGMDVSKYDGQNWTKITISTFNTQVRAISVDPKGKIWFAINGGVVKLDGSSLEYFYTGNSTLPKNDVLSIAIDNKGNKYFGTIEGVAKYNDTTWTKLPGLNFAINAIAFDKNNNGWFGSYQQAIIKMEGNKLINYTLYGSENSIESFFIQDLLIDSKGNKWFGTYIGISKYDDTTWTNYSSSFSLLKRGRITKIVTDDENKIWFGSTRGVFVLEGEIWSRYTIKDGLSSNEILSIAIDKKGNKWFGTPKGVSIFDGKNWTNLEIKNGLSENVVYDIAIDGLGNKWFSTAYGVSKYDKDSIWTYYSNPDSNLGERNYTNRMFIDSEENIWFGTTGNGLVKYDGKKWIKYLNSNYSSVNPYAQDMYGNIWCSYSNGIVKFDGVSWTFYGSEYDSGFNGLINDIKIDNEGAKWLASSYDGLKRFDDFRLSKYLWDLTYETTNGYGISSVAIDSRGNKWIASQDILGYFNNNGSGPFNINIRTQKGIIFHDLNANGKKDLNETNISGQIVKVDNNYTTTQNNGLFYTSLNNGSHTFTYRPQLNWKLTTDSNITIIVSDAPIKDTLYFGVQAIANKHEVETKLTGTATRAGFESKSWINYTNRGTLGENGTLSYTLAEETSLVQSIPVADSTIGKRLVWKYSNLIPNEQRQISITTQMPSVNFLGDTLVSISKIKSAFSEYSDTLKQILTGSYDPNDKLVAQGIGSKGYVLFGKELEYTVRFQNTGTDTAFNVNIRDTLDLNLDVASLQIVASSHPVKLDLRGQNEATFRFENILLPDSNANQLGSNGFVKYTIRPKKNLPENTPVKNKAHIYFDFNPAIITNETVNTYVSKLPSLVTGIQGFQSYKSATIFPNPAKDEFTIVFPQSGTYEISLANIQGKSIKTWNEIVGQETTLSLDGLEPGMYLYTAQSRNGQKYMGKLVVGR